ncbi:hypothetical protein ACFV94_04445 [Streptomyces sp. NPDC059896]|uniref:hypothetical protein n=1 Tax=Streptomyces sp. NPDC059896 TaxID=3346993 RepID=UPI00364E8A8A
MPSFPADAPPSQASTSDCPGAPICSIERFHKDAEAGLSLRHLAERHGVSQRTVRAALTGVMPPARERPSRYRKAPVIASIRHIVIPMISRNVSAKDIWKTLMDDHGISISFSTLNAYVRNQRTSYRAPTPPAC